MEKKQPQSGDFTMLSSAYQEEGHGHLSWEQKHTVKKNLTAAMDEDQEPQSGDFTVLSSTSRPEAEELRDFRQAREKERDAAIRRLCDMCGREDKQEQNGEGVQGGTRPLRIVVVGKHGAGKSSFINGVAAALSEDRWREHAYTGDRGRGAPITIVNQRFEKCCNGNRERYQRVHLPTFIDVAGLSDEADDKMEELLRLLFYGHIQEDEAVMKVYEDCRKTSTDLIRRQYSRSYPTMRVDRIVFVASSADQLPDRLMACVLRAARPSHHMDVRRAVPLYGVLTKMDKVDTTSTSFLDLKRKFMQDLGLNQARLLVCRNYCDDLDPEGHRTRQLDPDIDLPYIYFLQQLCDCALTVIREDEVLPGSVDTKEEQQNAENALRQATLYVRVVQQAQDHWTRADPLLRDILLTSLIFLVLLLLVSALGPSSATMCHDGTIDPRLCEQGSPWVGVKVMVNHIVKALVGGLAFFGWRYYNRL